VTNLQVRRAVPIAARGTSSRPSRVPIGWFGSSKSCATEVAAAHDGAGSLTPQRYDLRPAMCNQPGDWARAARTARQRRPQALARAERGLDLI